ncbi:MAG: cobalamin B12-binding domain-containing protein [Tateyamaria sp.]|jgi:MerR family transcriptional regulator, light-induced transcriptional regulator|nr:cobalamin B12-binding domain-containing protein [Tateyamaria sp.]MDG1335777.1 cobalamin B12-binding domain-containing protein [Tateyamaria sp.]MDG2058423.1 cobalamin B12-binding domain-containing protein [Tateyamaria sp.]
MANDDTYDMIDPSAGLDTEPLAAQVVSLLSERQTVNPAGARKVIFDYLVRASLSQNLFDPVQVMHELRGYRLTVDAIIDLYVPQAAIELGQMWQTSDIDFADVTIGSLRLQALLTEATAEMPHLPAAGIRDVLSALMIVPEGEQHFLGANVVAAQLRRLGCDAAISFCETPKQVLARIIGDQPDMVLMSCARAYPLGAISMTVQEIKTNANPVPVIALGGAIRGDVDGIKALTGVDLVTNSPKDVVGFCTKRRKAIGRG